MEVSVKRIISRVVAIGAGTLMLLQFVVVPSLVHARPSMPIAYVDDSADGGCNGRSAALSPDSNGDCAYQEIGQGITAVITDGSGIVNVAAGNYYHDTYLRIDYPMTLIGAGQGITKVFNDTSFNEAMSRLKTSL
jgi:hypothetical protein